MPSPAPPACSLTALKTANTANTIVHWYERFKRDLPWRHTRDPYAIWLSEIMLQQTQVKTVLPYYDRFLTLFPTITQLANAHIEQVMKAWEGLGYYARCRNMHKAAQVVRDNHQGKFPDTLEAVEALPGIGRSTAGAILTFAFHKPYPLLDGNVKRVLARLYAIQQDPAQPEITRQMWALSTQLVNGAEDPISFNQAIMEIGATLCTPKKPQCLLCPVRTDCEAAEQGIQEQLPIKAQKAPTPHHHIAVAVIFNTQGQVYIQRRPPEGLLGGLWEFPGGKQEPGEGLSQTILREVEEEMGLTVTLANQFPLARSLPQPPEPQASLLKNASAALSPEENIPAFMVVKHAYTHFKITLHAFYTLLQAGTPKPTAADAWEWVTIEDLPQYAFPKANKRVLEYLVEQYKASPHAS